MSHIKILFLFLNNISLYLCLFKNSKHVKEFKKIADLEKDMQDSKNKAGMVFIYSDYCGHCHHFAKTYDQLADNFFNIAEFYAVNVNTDYYKKFGHVYAVPHILFYSNDKFTKHSGDRSFENISKILKEKYLTYCQEISFAKVETISNEFFNKKEYKNLIIGFLKDKNQIESFRTASNKLYDKYIDSCYVCSDFESFTSSKTDNIIYKDINDRVFGYLNKQKKEIMKFFWDSSNELNEKNYEEFIINDLYFGYDDIYSNNKLFLLDNNPNKKNILAFVYQNITEKNIYELNINELFSLSKNISLTFYKIILYDFKNVNYNKLKNITKTGIYEISEDFRFIREINDINSIKNSIKKEMGYSEINKNENTDKNKSGIGFQANDTNIPGNKSKIVIEVIEEKKSPYIKKIKFKINRLMLEKASLVLFCIINISFLYTFFYCKYYQNANKNNNTKVRHKH